MSTLKVDTVRPVTTDGSLTLQGDSSGAGVTGLVIDSTGTVTTGTIGSGVVFPAGHIITHSTYYSQAATQYYETNSATFTDMGLEISITPKFSSADSFIVVNFYTGMAQDEESNGIATINYSTSSGVTTESSSTKIINATYPVYIGAFNPISYQLIHSNYSANTTQYYRIFLRSISSGFNVRLIYNSSSFSFYAYEVKK